MKTSKQTIMELRMARIKMIEAQAIVEKVLAENSVIDLRDRGCCHIVNDGLKSNIKKLEEVV